MWSIISCARLENTDPGSFSWFRRVGFSVVSNLRRAVTSPPLLDGRSTSRAAQFRDTFGAHFQDEQGKPIIPDVFAALSYDGANLLLNAITDAGTADAEAVRSTLERIEFHGLTGTIHFDPQHNPIKPAVILAVTPDGFVFQGLVKP